MRTADERAIASGLPLRSSGDTGAWAVRLRRPLLAQALLLVGLLGALGSFTYDEIAQLRPVSLLCVLALFSWLVISVRFDSRWVKRVFLPAFGLLFLMVLYAYVFTLRTDAPLLPSILSQRDYAYLLLGPIVYLLYLRGWKLRDFQQTFLAAVFLTVAGLAAYDVALSSRSLLLSGSFFTLNLGEVSDQSSIYRLVNTSALFLAVYLGGRLLQIKDAAWWGAALAAMALSAAILAISLPRGLLASIGAALLVYALFLSRPDRAKLALITLPLYATVIALTLPYFSNAFVDTFGQDRTYVARVEEAQKARESFLEYPLLGFGSDSVQSISFQDLFGHFYPSDIGLLGVAFQYGLVGVALYLLFGVWLCLDLLRLLWSHTDRLEGKQRTFLWALFVICLSFLIASPTQAKLLYGTGLPIGAFAWGLLMAHAHGRTRIHPSPGTERAEIPEPATSGHR